MTSNSNDKDNVGMATRELTGETKEIGRKVTIYKGLRPKTVAKFLHDAHLKYVLKIDRGDTQRLSEAMWIPPNLASGFREVVRYLRINMHVAAEDVRMLIERYLDYGEHLFEDPDYREVFITARSVILEKLMHDIELNPGPDFMEVLVDVLAGKFDARVVNMFHDEQRQVLIAAAKCKPQAGWFDPLKIGQFSDAMIDCVDRLVSKADDVMNMSNAISQRVTRTVNNSSDTFRDTIAGFTTSIVDLFKHPIHGSLVFAVTYVSLQLLDGVLDANHMRMAKIIVGGAAVTYLSMDVVKPFLGTWASVLSSGFTTPQAGLMDWITLAIEGISLITLGFKIELKSVSSFVDSLSSISRAASTIDGLISKICEWFKRLICAFGETFSFDVHQWFLSNDKQVRSLQKEINELMQDYFNNPMSVDSQFSTSVARIAMKVNDLIVNTPTSNVSQRAAVNKLQEQVNNLMRYISEQGVGVGDRDEPGITVLAGPPGGGKTFFSDFLKQKHVVGLATNERELKEIEENWKSHVYTWPVEGKHHDQYRGESVVDFPDLFARKDIAGGDSEPLNLIYLVGGQAMQLPAAELTKKQKLWMVSRSIVACTNVTYIGNNLFDSIRNPDAVRRRVNECAWYLYPNPAYALRDVKGDLIIDPNVKRVLGYTDKDELYASIDPTKVPATDALPPDCYFLRRFSFTTGTFVDSRIYTQDEAAQISLEYLGDKTNRNKKKRELLAANLQALLERRRQELKGEPMAQANRAEVVPHEDTEFEERMAKLAEPKDDTCSFVTADDGRRRTSFKPRKGTFAKPRFKSYAHAAKSKKGQKARPQSGLRPDKEWFFHDPDNDEEKELLRKKVDFLYRMRDSFTEDCYYDLRRVYLHAYHGCVMSTSHDCVNPVITADDLRGPLPLLTQEQVNAFRRLVADSPKLNFLTLKLHSLSLVMLANEAYKTARSRIIELVLQSEYGSGPYAQAMYCYFMLSEMLLPYYKWAADNVESLMQYVRPYTPILVQGFSFLAGYAVTSALTIGVAFLLGLPSGWKFIDRRREPNTKWNPEYVMKLHDAKIVVYEYYDDYDAYSQAKMYIDIRNVDDVDVKTLVVPRLRPQASWKTDESWQGHAEKVAGNCYMVYYCGESKEGPHDYLRHPCNAIFIGERTCMMVHHAADGINWLEKADDVYSNIVLVPFNSGMKPQDSPLRFRWKDIIQREDPLRRANDIVVLQFPSGLLKMHPRIDKMLPPRESLEYVQRRSHLEGVFIQKPTSCTLPFGSLKYVDVFLNWGGDVTYADNVEIVRNGESKNHHTGDYTYSAWSVRGRHSHFVTQDGDCSSPVLLTDPRKNICVNHGYKQGAQPWLVYMHTALHGSCPRGTALYRELFSDVISEMYTDITPLGDRIERDVRATVEVLEKASGIVSQGSPVELELHHEQLDKVHYTEFAVNADVNLYPMGNIKRSKVYGLDERLRAPARLRDFINPDGIKVSILANAEKDYGANATATNYDLLCSVSHDVINRFINDNPAERRAENLSLLQALLGDAGHSLKGIDMTTSAGFLLRSATKKMKIDGKGKTYMSGDTEKLSPEYMKGLEELIKKCEETLASGDRVTNVYIDNLKDELLLKEKVAIGKTRLFCSAEFTYLILLRMYFGSFAGWIFRGRIHNGIAIGINVYSKEWDAVFAHLNDHSPNVIFGDYSRFDKSQKRCLMRVVIDLAHIYYGDVKGSRNWIIREMLFEDLCDSVHITVRDGKLYIYTWEHGNTSGNFLTAIINSLVNILILHYACVCAQLLHHGKDPQLCDGNSYNWEEVCKGLRYEVLGDDVIAAIKGGLKEYVNFHSMSYCIKKYVGLDFTDELKGTTGDDIPPFRSIYDGSFLGRKFRPDNYKGALKIFAPLRMYSVIEHLQWVKGVTDPEIETAKFELTFLELAQYPEQIFNQYAFRYAAACEEAYGMYPRFADYDIARDRVSRLSTDRYAFETFLVEDTYKDSDLAKLGLLTRDL